MFDIRLGMVLYAKKQGNKPAAKYYNTTVKTVKLWRKRFEERGKKGLENLSTKPKSSPNKLSTYKQKKIIELRKKKEKTSY